MVVHPSIVQEIQRERQESARRERVWIELRGRKPPLHRSLLAHLFRRGGAASTPPLSVPQVRIAGRRREEGIGL